MPIEIWKLGNLDEKLIHGFILSATVSFLELEQDCHHCILAY